MKNVKNIVIVIVAVVACVVSFSVGSHQNDSELKSLNSKVSYDINKIKELTESNNNNVKYITELENKATEKEQKESDQTKEINSLKAEKDSINNELNEAYEEIKADTKELDRLNSLVSQQTQTAPQVENTAKEVETQAQTVQTVATNETTQKDEFETLLNNFTAEMTKLDNSDYAMKSGLNVQEYQNSLLSSIENKELTDDEKAQLKSVIGGLVETFNNIVNGTF